jgi:hypothetical protein
MQGLLGVAPLSVTQIFSAACSSSPLVPFSSLALLLHAWQDQL